MFSRGAKLSLGIFLLTVFPAIAQDPEEAEHSSMPATAISTGMVDWVLPVEKMAPKLSECINAWRGGTIPDRARRAG